MQARLCGVGGTFLSNAGPVWVFGYGSLIWRADFAFAQRRRASIDGFVRRFWQGSHDHRGTPSAPGRVVTLVPEVGARCIGVAYLVDHAVFEHLDHREKNGYRRDDVELTFEDGRSAGVVYVADQRNPAFLGNASLDAIARQIAESRGPSGHNAEYLYELARALRDLDVQDRHVFELEAQVRSLELDGHSSHA